MADNNEGNENISRVPPMNDHVLEMCNFSNTIYYAEIFKEKLYSEPYKYHLFIIIPINNFSLCSPDYYG